MTTSGGCPPLFPVLPLLFQGGVLVKKGQEVTFCQLDERQLAKLRKELQLEPNSLIVITCDESYTPAQIICFLCQFGAS